MTLILSALSKKFAMVLSDKRGITVHTLIPNAPDSPTQTQCDDDRTKYFIFGERSDILCGSGTADYAPSVVSELKAKRGLEATPILKQLCIDRFDLPRFVDDDAHTSNQQESVIHTFFDSTHCCFIATKYSSGLYNVSIENRVTFQNKGPQTGNGIKVLGAGSGWSAVEASLQLIPPVRAAFERMEDCHGFDEAEMFRFLQRLLMIAVAADHRVSCSFDCLVLTSDKGDIWRAYEGCPPMQAIATLSAREARFDQTHLMTRLRSVH